MYGNLDLSVCQTNGAEVDGAVNGSTDGAGESDSGMRACVLRQ